MSSQGASPHPQWLSDQRSIVEPAVFSREIEAQDAVICFSRRVYASLIDAFDLRDAGDAPRFAGALESAVDDAIAIHWAYFGAPAAGLLMETLIASGVERFVMVGQAGAISPRCKIGDLVLPTWGVREEGVSYHYLSPDVRCEVSEELLGVVKEYMGDIGFEEGGVWSTDAQFRETPEKVLAYAVRGVLAVEMECTALMAIAMVRHVDFAAALMITDELFGGSWRRGFRSPHVTALQDLLCERLAQEFRQRGRFAGGDP